MRVLQEYAGPVRAGGFARTVIRMSSTHAAWALLRTVVVGALVASVGSGAVAPASAHLHQAAPPTVVVDPADLPQGALPRIPWLDSDAELIRQPGRPSISTVPLRDGPSHLQSELLRVKQGYLVNVPVRRDGVPSGSAVVLVTPSGHRRVVAKASTYDAYLGSRDGRWFVAVDRDPALLPHRARVRAIRVSDGKVLGTRTFTGVDDLQPAAAGDGRVLLSRTIRRDRTHYYLDALVWTPTRGTVTLLDRRVSRTRGGVMAASTGAHRFTVVAAGKDAMLDLRTKRQLWRVAERIGDFSPDGELVFTFAGGSGWDEDTGFAGVVLRIRDARSGRRLVTFKGLAAGYRSPTWETATTFLAFAPGRAVWHDETETFSYPDASLVRCSVTSTSCRRVNVNVYTSSLMVHRSS